jgi:hypothetical protein
VIEAVLNDESGPWPKSEVLSNQIVKAFLYVVQLRRAAEALLDHVDRLVRIELGTIVRETLADIESDLAGYFIFRDILDQSGLQPVVQKLGSRVDERELSSQAHRVIRDPLRRGALRIFGLGIQIDGSVVSGSTVMKSGGEDDRD